DEYLPFSVTAESADRRFRAWARKSWFRAKGLDAVEIGLRPMLLPAWRFHGRLETHWAGLRAARTRSGKAPIAGFEHRELIHMVPASAGLTQDELLALLPFDEAAARPWSSFDSTTAESDPIWEPPALTRRGARTWAHRGLASAHARRLARDHALLRCRVSAVVEERDVRLLLVPIYIGVFRYRDRPWRFLVNGQTGELVGDAPVNRLAILAVALLVVAIVAVAMWLGHIG
ncbi:MAG TPA: hypothetical protein VK034_12250, partial [Enhygromyxa sp.]|nr:hypothetical protein [Enhygromyxa sp.]